MALHNEIALDGLSLAYPSFDLAAELATKYPPLHRAELHIARSPRGPVRPQATWQQLIDNLQEYNAKTGVEDSLSISFVGGNPLFSELLVPLAAFGADIDVGEMSVDSTLVRTGTSVRRFNVLLEEAFRPGRDLVIGRIDAITESVGEQMNPGSTVNQALFMATSGLVHAQNAGIDVVGSTTITRVNRDEVPKVVAFAQSKRLRVGPSQPEGVGHVREWRYRQSGPKSTATRAEVLHGPYLDESTTLGIFFNAALRNHEHRLRSKLILNQNANHRTLSVDPDGVAYCTIIDPLGRSQEIVFGNIMEDFSGTMYEYGKHYARAFTLENLAAQYAEERPLDFGDPRIGARLLSSLIAATYDSQALPERLIRPRSDGQPESEPAAMSPREVDIDLSVRWQEDARQPVTAAQWSNIMDELAVAGLNTIRLTGTWQENPLRESLLASCQRANVRTTLVATEVSPELLAAIDSQTVHEVVVPLTLSAVPERLRGRGPSPIDSTTVTRVQEIYNQLITRPTMRLTLQVAIGAQDIANLVQLPQPLEKAGIDRSRIRLEIIEREPLRIITDLAEQSSHFHSSSLQDVVTQLNANGCQDIVVRHWALQPGTRVTLDRFGNLVGTEILRAGPVRPLAYGNLVRHGTAAILAQYRNHLARITARLDNIRQGHMPMGRKSSALATADGMQYNDPVSEDILAAYYRGQKN